MTLSPVELFYGAAAQGIMPFGVPVMNEDGERTLHIMGAPIGPQRALYAFHPDERVRVEFMFRGLRQTRRSAETVGLVPIDDDLLIEECAYCEGVGCPDCGGVGYRPHECS